MGISGTGVAIATAGGVLIYAGLTKQNPIAALRAVGSGHPAPISTTSAYQATQSQGVQLAHPGDGSVRVFGQVSMIGAQLVTAVEQYSGDQYSQAKRWQPGFSDCSSFVGKGFKACGITPPGASTTWDYLGWSKLSKVAPADVVAGDLICNQTHIIVATSNSDGIGQENPRRNVATGPITDLMAYTGSYVCLRYTG